jgi:ankyrin repeat protein
LLAKGADPNKFLQGGWSPIEVTFERGVDNRCEIAKLLIDYGADTDLYGSYAPAFMREVRRFWSDNFYEMSVYRNTSFLLDNGANPIGPTGITALHYAAIGNKAKATEELIENYYHHELDNVDGNGQTPLIWGAEEGSTEAVKVLLEYGADKSIKDAAGKTAYDYAIENGHTELAELLKP